VANGWVTLKGEVEWNFQREAAARSVRDLLGVVGVTNGITLTPHVRITDVQAKIEAALKRNAEVDARRIHVTAADGKVTLTGNVHSWTERREATMAAWAAPGVHEVDNRLAVTP
jgi:osmotically-inducible protein OsmY